MKNIRKFETISEFNAAYNGDEYLEPWVSLTEEAGGINYNKKPLWLRIPQYMPFGGGTENYTSEELEIVNHILDYFGVQGFDVQNPAVGTYTCSMPEPIMLYFVGGLTPEFDQDDSETYLRKFVPEEVSFVVTTVENDTYPDARVRGRFSFDDGNCFEGYADVAFLKRTPNPFWVEGESQDNCDGSK